MVNFKSLYYQIFRDTVLLMHLNEEKKIVVPPVEINKGQVEKLPPNTKFVNSEAGIVRLSELQRIEGLIERGQENPKLADKPHYSIPKPKSDIRKIELFPRGMKKQLYPAKK